MSKFRTIGIANKSDPSRKKLVKGPNGNNLCRFCKKEVSPPRRTFCSGKPTKYSWRKVNGIKTKCVYSQGNGCVHEYMIRSRHKYAREAVFDRDQGVCALCGKVHARKGKWQADHIIPVVEGGGECGLENFRILCADPCHKKVTKELRTRLAANRKVVQCSSSDMGNADIESCNRIHVATDTSQ